MDLNGGPGAQHISIRIDDIFKTVNELRDNGIKFLNIPDNYYETLYKLTKENEMLKKIDLEILHKN